MSISKFVKSLGPGLLYAGAAVGVSHLVQSTRVGASFGYDLIWILLIANLIKYPFFEFAPRYSVTTGKSLVHGYTKMGKWALILFILLTVSTMFAVTAAISLVTSGLLASLTGWDISIYQTSTIIMLLIMFFLLLGRFKLLEGMMKYIILILSVSTVMAVIFAFKPQLASGPNFDWNNVANLALLIAFVGWMPAPLDVSVWYSTWTVAKQKNSEEKINLKTAIRDFNIGYIGTVFLAIFFLMLGALIMYGSGETFSSEGVAFSGQLIKMYTSSLGSWAHYIIGIAAFTTMLSTSITVLDAYPRVLEPSFRLLRAKGEEQQHTKFNKSYLFWLLLVIIGSLVLMIAFGKSMKFMVDFATTLSFVTAPLLAILNYCVVMNLPKKNHPKKWLQVLSWIGMLLLSLFSIFYVIRKFF